MNKEVIGSALGTSMSVVGTAAQTNQVLQSISIILTILGTIITIVMAILNWWNNAKKDGKIDEEEAKEGIGLFKKLFLAIKSLFSRKKDK